MNYLESLGPVSLSFFAAITYAFAQMFYREAVTRLGSSRTVIIVNTMMFSGGVIAYALSEGSVRWEPAGIFWFVMVGLFGPFASRHIQYRAIPQIGISRYQILLQTVPIWSAAIAILFVGEVLRPFTALGTVFIIAGSIFLVKEHHTESRDVSSIYLVFPLIAACLLGATPTFRKFGYVHISSASFGMAVGLGAGLLFSLVSYFLFSREEEVKRWKWRPSLLVMVGGAINAASAVAYWRAIHIGDVVAVIPITRLSLLFVLLFSWVLFRRQERITGRVLTGAALALAGALAITAVK